MIFDECILSDDEVFGVNACKRPMRVLIFWGWGVGGGVG